jgi:hypothetical protein
MARPRLTRDSSTRTVSEPPHLERLLPYARLASLAMGMPRLHPCRWCGHLPRTDKYQPLGGDWVYTVECSSPTCDNAEVGDSEEEAAQLWNWANPDPGGNVPIA